MTHQQQNRIPATPPVANERTSVTVYEEANFQGASKTGCVARNDKVGTLNFSSFVLNDD